jgi:hypothetical protein
MSAWMVESVDIFGDIYYRVFRETNGVREYSGALFAYGVNAQRHADDLNRSENK